MVNINCRVFHTDITGWCRKAIAITQHFNYHSIQLSSTPASQLSDTYIVNIHLKINIMRKLIRLPISNNWLDFFCDMIISDHMIQ